MNRLPPEAFGTAWIKEPFRFYEGERYEDTKYALTRNGVALAAKVVTIYVLEAYELDDGRSLVFATDWSEVLPADRTAWWRRIEEQDDVMSPAHWDWMSKCDSTCGFAAGHWKWRYAGKVPLTAEEEAAWREYARRHELPEDPSLGLEAYARDYHRIGPPWPRIRIYLLDRRGRIRDHVATARLGAVPNLQVVRTDRQSIEFSLFSPTEVFRLRILDRPCLTWLARPFWHGKLGRNWMVVELASPDRKA